MLKHLPLSLLGLALVQPLTAQQSLALTRPTAEYAEPFTNLRSILELADGKVLTADLQDKTVQLIDLARGTALKIGREGQGPEEYMLPLGLFPGSGGGAVLQDVGNQRFLPIGTDGKIGKSFTPPQPPASGSGEGGRRMIMMGRLMDVRGADASGNLYYQGSVLSMADESVDSVPLMRWQPSAARVDTLAWLPVTASMRPQVQRGASGNAVMVRMGGGVAWPSQPAWGASAGGRLAIVTPEPYQVTWIQGTRRTAGPVIPVTPIKVTEAEKQAYLDRQRRTSPVVMTFGGPRGAAAPRAAPARAEDIQFPETMPPFSGRDAVLVTPEGEVWISRLRSAKDHTPRYDVFDGQGNRVGEVRLRPDSRVVGFGKGTVYVVRSDEDDLQYLERYNRPGRLGQ